MDDRWEAISRSLQSAAETLRRRSGSTVQLAIAERLQAAAEGRCDREAACRTCPVQCWQPGQPLRAAAGSHSR
jgi:hypothetical protein